MSNDAQQIIKPVGVVLPPEQMPIGYDNRIGDKVWFETAPIGKLYAERDVEYLIKQHNNKIHDNNS